ncbi:conserved Plasmodium protein, unknown function [Plasmodium ovale wallikeri]|uniref:Uncharacterized protein n=2 Tax=Plasmodium ovale TaxID=36330 RepID=A0A1A8Z711_PLAOA|nr:conserved Plasmodium protein, unknown function [Plasmodium ovale wallikeri]SBT40276.1 conserved Plasmodium protein, unknown function [Plasmodium ovale wallikeri]SBT77931.1 conserved Plasmodium protein, unknown function [Plasmodium ovale]
MKKKGKQEKAESKKRNVEQDKLQKYMDEFWGFSASSEGEEKVENSKKKNAVSYTDENATLCNNREKDNGWKSISHLNGEKKKGNADQKRSKRDDTVSNNINFLKKAKNSLDGNVLDDSSEVGKNIQDITGKGKKRKKNELEWQAQGDKINCTRTTDTNFLINGKKKKVPLPNILEEKKDENKYHYENKTYLARRKGEEINSSHNMNDVRCGEEANIVSKQKKKQDISDKIIPNKEKLYKEKMKSKKFFMDTVHEIRKLTLPHLNKFQRKNVENHQIKMLGGKFDKSQKVHYPELMCRKKSIKKNISKRKEQEKILGVKMQSGDYIDMQDVFRKKKREKQLKSKRLF